MKKLLLILLIATSVSGTIRTWNGTDFGGVIDTVDTLRWNATSVVNYTAATNISCRRIDITSAYTGTISFSGRTVTVGGGFYARNTGNFTAPKLLVLNGTDSMVWAPTGSVSAAACTLTVNGSYTSHMSGYMPICKMYVNGYLNVGAASNSHYLEMDNGTTPLVFGLNGRLNISYGKTLGLVTYASCTIISGTPNITGLGSLVLQTNLANNYTVQVPKIMCYGLSLTLKRSFGGNTNSTIFNFTDSISVGRFNTVQDTGLVTINARNKYIAASLWQIGSSRAGSKNIINIDSSFVDVGTVSQTNADTVWVNCQNTIFNVYANWQKGTRQIYTGTYTTTTPVDLALGHSQITNHTGYYIQSPFWFYQKNYGNRYFKDRAVFGEVISTTKAKTDTCLSTYNPNRVFIWQGDNDFPYTDSVRFDSALVPYFKNLDTIITKCKNFGIANNKIFVIGQAPYGTAKANASLYVSNFKRYNLRLRDTLNAKGVRYIDAWNGLITAPGNDLLKPEYSLDGVHLNSTVEGSTQMAKMIDLWSSTENQYYLDSIGVFNGLYFKGLFDIVDSVYFDGQRISTFTQTDTTLQFAPLVPVMWDRDAYPLTLYCRSGAFRYEIKFKKSGGALGSQLSIRVTTGF